MFGHLRNMVSRNFIYLCLHPKIFDVTKKTSYCFCLKMSKSDCGAVGNLAVNGEEGLAGEIVAAE